MEQSTLAGRKLCHCRGRVHAVSKDASAGRIYGEGGRVANSRLVRRLGPVDAGEGQPQRWVGFAGLARKVTERLIEEGGRRDEDRRSCPPQSSVLADVRHVLGGVCAAVSYTPLRKAVRAAQTYVEGEGGGGRGLHTMICEAAEALSSSQGGHRARLGGAA